LPLGVKPSALRVLDCDKEPAAGPRAAAAAAAKVGRGDGQRQQWSRWAAGAPGDNGRPAHAEAKLTSSESEHERAVDLRIKLAFLMTMITLLISLMSLTPTDFVVPRICSYRRT